MKNYFKYLYNLRRTINKLRETLSLFTIIYNSSYTEPYDFLLLTQKRIEVREKEIYKRINKGIVKKEEVEEILSEMEYTRILIDFLANDRVFEIYDLAYEIITGKEMTTFEYVNGELLFDTEKTEEEIDLKREMKKNIEEGNQRVRDELSTYLIEKSVHWWGKSNYE